MISVKAVRAVIDYVIIIIIIPIIKTIGVEER
jgi:hypothetical protein